MSPKFQVYKDTAGKIRFRFRADNNQIVASGEACGQHESCIRGIASIINNRNAPVVDLTKGESMVSNPKFEVYKDSDGRYRFRLKAADGEVIAQGEAYDAKQACLSCIELMRGCYSAMVEDPFATEVVIESELPRTPAISVTVVPKPANVIYSFSDNGKASSPVISMLTLLGLEFAFGLTEGVMKAAGRTREAAVESIVVSVQ